MVPVVFDNKALSHHSLYGKCSDTLTAVSERDYPGRDYFDPAIECLDMDSYETKVSHGQSGSTMDAVIGISDCDNKRMLNSRLLLVELRLDYKSANNFSKTKLESKISHTKDLLGVEMMIDKQSVFVFSESVAPRARHWIEAYKHEGGDIKYSIVYTPADFSKTIVSFDSLPYKPINNPEQLIQHMLSLVDMSRDIVFFQQVRHWMAEMENYRYRNAFESRNIGEILEHVWNYYKEHRPSFENEDVEMDYLVLDEDIVLLLGRS